MTDGSKNSDVLISIKDARKDNERKITVFDAVQSPLCLVPLWILKNLGLWKNFDKKFM